MIELSDRNTIARQIGRTPRGGFAVAARCHSGHPSVITSYPLRRIGERVVPFPTLYWLTCPRLCKQIASLERDGVIAQISAEIARDDALRARLFRDHKDYIARRWAALSADDQLLVSQCGLVSDFQRRGIGGMTNFAAVKCLHLHVAHHLASSNVIGELLIRRYGLNSCGSS